MAKDPDFKKMKKIILLGICLVCLINCKPKETLEKKPKLVVGVVIDQMRYDYLTRFYDRFGKGGFKRLLNDGFSLENAHFNYIPTYTAVGHASIFTGTTPDNHGIISNDWYDKFQKKSIYCVTDTTYNSVGTASNRGQRSPFRMMTTTVSDQLHLAQNGRGKSIGIAIKDRSAILPVGHTANAAYWFDGGIDGNFITSSFYMNNLPNWVKEFNEEKNAEKYLTKNWETLYDIATYTNSIADNNKFERPFLGKTEPTFPYNLQELKVENGIGLLNSTPFGSTFTLDFAKRAIEKEQLGTDDDVDFLTVSFSSPDYIGHQFGPASVEIEDTYLRLDKDLENFLNYLDEKVGKDNYTLFLTADHAAVNVPSYLQSLKIPAHYFDFWKFREFALQTIEKYFNANGFIENISNYQIFLNKENIESKGFTVDEVAQKLADEVINFDGVYKAVTARTLQTTRFTDGILNSLQNGYNQKYSGDVMMIPYPATLTGSRKGTSHGSGYSYDTHIPIIFYGNGIRKGVSKKRYTVIDIAPTIANLLKIEAPNSTTGIIIDEVLE